MNVDLQERYNQDMRFCRRQIEELEKKIERLERHNARFHQEYDPERDEPLDVAFELGRDAAWRDVADLALTKLVGDDHDKALGRLERERAAMRRELGALWQDHMAQPFPDDLYLPDVVKALRKELSQYAADESEDEERLPRVVYRREGVSMELVYVEPRFSWRGDSEEE